MIASRTSRRTPRARSTTGILVAGGALVSLVALAPTGPAGAASPRWSVQATPNPALGVENILAAVSCPAETSCATVGYVLKVHARGVPVPLAESWNGAAWSIRATPRPVGSAYSMLEGVSCVTPDSCMAVGTDSNGTLAEAWNGRAWSVVSSPNPSRAYSSTLDSVSCTSAAACTAAGWYSAGVTTGRFSTLRDFSLVETWDGSTWSIVPTPNPSPSFDTSFRGVSCTSDACTAVGGYRYANYDTVEATLVETETGGVWTIVPSPHPAGSSYSFLDAVSCTADDACTAVGGGPNNHTLAETWNGSVWSIEPTPSPRGSVLSGVDCTAGSCEAVGGASSTPLAEARADPDPWAIQTMPEPAGFIGGAVDAVSCSGAAACTAVGSYNGSIDGAITTLAERFSD